MCRKSWKRIFRRPARASSGRNTRWTKLFISIGEQTSNDPAQDMDTFLGKILRINSDGSIPVDNPFYATAEGKYRAIWALGCRNVFGFAVEPKSGRLFLNDVGGAREEINVSAKGGENFGWPAVEHGVNSKGKFVDAIYSYPFASIVGGDFCDEKKCAGWPKEYWGKYFFMDYVHGWIKVLDPEKALRLAALAQDGPADVKEFASGVPFGTDLRFSANGSLYVLVRDMWVNEKSFFKKGTGFVVKIGMNLVTGLMSAAGITCLAAAVILVRQAIAFIRG